MHYPTLQQQFWQDGYLVIDDFFASQLMDQYQHTLIEHYGLEPEYAHDAEFLEKSATEVIPWFPQQDGNVLFDSIEQDPRLIELTAAILGEGWQALYCMSMFSRQGTKGQAWHQDCPPEESGKFNLNRLVYTHDIDPQDGGQLLVMPGSHRRGAVPVGDPNEDFEDQVVLSPKKGTLVLIHGHTWHRVLPITGAFRVSTNYRSVPKGTPSNVTDVCVYRNMRYRFETSEVIEDRLA